MALERLKRWITWQLKDKFIPANLEQRWLWLPTKTTFHESWEGAFLPEGLREDAEVLKHIEEPVPYAYLFPLFSEYYCQWLIELAEEDNLWSVDKKDNYAAWEVNLAKVSSTVDAYHREVIVKQVMNPLFEGLYQWQCSKVFRIFFVKYEAGGTIPEMKSHWDEPSLVSVSVNLNDPNDYEGGHLTFLRTPDIAIKPLLGHGLMFSGNPAMSHQAHEVTKGTRYVLVYWLR